MNRLDEKYKDMIRHIMKNGVVKKDRTGTGTISVFDYTIRHKMSEGFPLITSKKMYWKGIVHELLWFLRGDTNIKCLVENGCHIWDGDAYKSYKTKIIKMVESWDAKYHEVLKSEANSNRPFTQEEFIERIKTDDKFAAKWGDLGPIYGHQWRKWGGHKVKHRLQHASGGSFGGPTSITYGDIVEYDVPGVDQIQNLIDDLKNNPDSRRLMVNAWNVGDIDSMTLPPCHYGFQCYTYEMSLEERVSEWCRSLNKSIHYGDDMTSEKLDEIGFPVRKLSLKWTQRSTDSGLGLPFNFASYGLLLMMVANEVNMIPDELIFSGGDCHIYLNHFDGMNKQMRQESYLLPKVVITKKPIFDITIEDISLSNYQSSPKIEMPLSN